MEINGCVYLGVSKCNRKMEIYKLLAAAIGLLCVFLSIHVYAVPEIIEPSTSIINASDKLEFLEDPERSLSITNVSSGKENWKRNRTQYVNFGYTRSAYWFRCLINNSSGEKKDLYLEIDFPLLDSIELYTWSGAGKWTVKKTGDSLPFSSRDVPDRSFIFNTGLSPGINTIFLRVATEDALRFHFTVLPVEQHIRIINQTIPFYWLFFGMMIFIAFYNLFIFLSTREHAYFYLFLFSVSFFFYQFKLRGFAAQYLPAGMEAWTTHAAFLFYMAAAWSSCLFLRSALETRKNYPVLDRMYFYTGIIPPPLICLLPFIVPFFLAARVSFFFLLVYITLSIAIMVYSLARGNRYARFVLTGFIFLALIGLDVSLTALNVHNKTIFSDWGLEMGITWFMVFSSLGLADKINVLKNTLISSEQTISRQNAALVRSNEELTVTIEELEAANEELNTTLEEFEAQNQELIAAEHELEQSELRYRTIVEEQIEFIVRVSPDGTISFANKAFCGFYHSSPAEIRGVNLSKFGRKDGIDRIMGEIRELSGKESSRMFDVRISGENNELYWVQVNATGIFDPEGALVEIQLVGRNITEKIMMESQLVQAQKMEAIGTLAGGLAHDFNNVLGAIMGSSSLLNILLKDQDLNDKSDIMMYIETINSSASRAADMIRQLLSLSRRQELRIVPVDLNRSLENVLNICKNTFPKSVALHFEMSPTPKTIHADPTQIEQALLNFCVNSSHAMTIMKDEGDKEGGTLKIAIGEILADGRFCSVHPEARRDARYFSIIVSDNGVGMDEATRIRIFEPFFTTKGKDVGTGLGLAMAYNIIRQHGGCIDVISEPGTGTTMIIYLPEPDGSSDAAADDRESDEIVRGSGTVLVIDDEKGVRTVASGILREAGYRVIMAEGGEEGVGIYRENQKEIDVVLLDLSMPVMSGLDVFRVLQEVNSGVKVLITSGFSLDIKIKKALDLGVKGFVQKPFSTRLLTERVSECMGN